MAAAVDERSPLINDQETSEELDGLSDIAVRHGFIQKVYGILGAQLLVTTLIAGYIMHNAAGMIKSNPALLLTYLIFGMVMSLGVMMVFICCPDTMRSSPTNYILLSIFTVAKAILVGFVCVQYTQASVLIALAVTTFVVLSLTAFSCQTKYDFTGMAPYIFALTMVFMGFGLTMMIMSWFFANSAAFQAARLLYAFGGALLFSVYIVFDTQMIVGGKHSQFRFSVDDYCMAAINLYLDIIQLFLFILEIMGKTD
eukprot:TRINITY_DN109532_c0_g1_i1.p1 TRINITY_DN109532_c0_g1~~TRINITY_DN109532_c0_g1_i1.p1  ORF type:complete len:255 (-),score=43.47 TRINITY_DN109532_c0_g1_i1:170-934(-)